MVTVFLGFRVFGRQQAVIGLARAMSIVEYNFSLWDPHLKGVSRTVRIEKQA
jgi:hypothetical protein